MMAFNLSMNKHLTPSYPQPFSQLKDLQPIRAACFHPSGEVYAIGSNTKTIRICTYPGKEEFKTIQNENITPIEPEIAFTFNRVHRGSIYCARFNKGGNLLATGSNDQAVHIIQYDHKKRIPVGSEYKLQIHSGTVRDVCFLNGSEEDQTPTLLASGGSGDFEICVTDCETMKPVQILREHEASIMSIYCWGDANTFISGSLDGTIRLWDFRSKLCFKTIDTNRLSIGKSPIGVVRVDDSGRLLVSGHKDGTCMLYDTKAGQIIQSFKAHDDDIRTVNFSPKSYYLLSASYDRKVKLIDLQGDLTRKIPMVNVAELDDKVVQTEWHPNDYNFITTCANGTATLWIIPELTITTAEDEATINKENSRISYSLLPN